MAASAPSPLPLLWYGPLLEPTGFDEEGASVLLALERAGLPAAARNLREPRAVADTTDAAARAAVERALARPLPEGEFVFLQHALLQGEVHDRGPTAARLMYETDRLPPDWLRRLHTCDELWLTSDHALQAFGEAGVPEERLHLLPMTLDFALYDPACAEPVALPEGARGFTFLTTFEFQERKGWDVLLEAWVEAFDADDDVSLVLKTFSLHGDTTAGLRERLDVVLAAACAARGAKRPAPVLLEPRVLAASELPGLYRASDAFVLASRGEGWGRPYMEAMAMGLPTIGSRWSGNLAFMNDENSFLVDGALRPVQRWDARSERDWKGHRWFSADVEHLAATLRLVAAGGAEVTARASRARASLLERCSPELVARRIAELTAVALERHAERRRRPVACVWRGEFGLHHSLAVSNLGTSRALESRLAAEGERLERAAPDALIRVVGDGAPVGIAQQWPPAWHPPAEGPYVLFQPWELSRVPAAWVDRIEARVDEVWVHSEHTRSAYVASGVESARVHVIGAGVDLDRFATGGLAYPLPAPAGGPGRARAVYLWVGGLIPRKGLDRLLAAWAAAFTADDDVCLVVKGHQTGGLYRDAGVQDLLERFAAQPGIAPIVVIAGDIGPEELPSLYRAADCLVQPYRAEGFCLPALEALACGVPVIATAGGPTDEFLDASCGWPVSSIETAAPVDWLPASLAVAREAGPPTMLEPDHHELVAALRAAADPAERERRALAARPRAEEWSWERTGAIAAERVRALTGTTPRRHGALRREPLADAAARGALEDLVQAAHTDVVTGATAGSRTATPPATRPGARGRRAHSAPQPPKLALPAVASGGVLSRALARIRPACDAHTGYGIVRETVTRLVNGAPALADVRAAGLTLDAVLALAGALEQEAREPVLLSELGVALFGLGEHAAAERVFRAVERLDADFTGVAHNLSALRAHRGPAPLRLDPGQRELARELARRAVTLADGIRPDTGRSITLCMIVRNEAAMLDDCLASADPWVDEIVVVDTGSTDETVEIADRYGAVVLHEPWRNSFATARNVSVDAATGDWILWLDADERLEEASGPLLRTLAERSWRVAFYARIENETGAEGRELVVHEALRLWRRRDDVRFEGRLHEQLTGIPFELLDRLERTDLTIRHLGYRREIAGARGKADRNRALLAEEQEGPFTWFSLANELQAEGGHAEALELYDRAWTAIASERTSGATVPHYLPVLALRRARAARSAGDVDGAVARVTEGLAEFADHTELVLEGAVCARLLRALDESARLAQHALALGEAPARYAPQVGSGTSLPLGLLATLRAEQGRLQEARDLAQTLITDHPDAVAAGEAARGEIAGWETLFTTLADMLDGIGADQLDRPASVTPTGSLADVFDACRAVAVGCPPGGVPAGGLQAMTAVLDALLDLGRFEAFERALEVWHALAEPLADRRDALARVYLRRGFLDSAHDEWATAWEETQDGRAVIGIARVESARGNRELAADLAGEALALDPSLVEACELLRSADTRS
jgi:glycosyltransferase involved in cell wall biosynthesis/tetratricopeptide (TPR) repeat protein